MATVTTTNSPDPRLRTFKRSPDPAAPFGELLFAATFTVAAKLSTNESQVIIACTLPPNFVYRLQALEIFVASDGENPFDDLEQAWTVVLTENQVTTRRFGLYNLTEFYTAASESPAIKVDPDSTTNDFGTYYNPINTDIGNQLIDSSEGSSVMTVQLMDTSADSTAAVVVTFRFLATAYTVDQFNEAPINTPRWVT